MDNGDIHAGRVLVGSIWLVFGMMIGDVIGREANIDPAVSVVIGVVVVPVAIAALLGTAYVIGIPGLWAAGWVQRRDWL
jgi:hypothetical protein